MDHERIVLDSFHVYTVMPDRLLGSLANPRQNVRNGVATLSKDWKFLGSCIVLKNVMYYYHSSKLSFLFCPAKQCQFA